MGLIDGEGSIQARWRPKAQAYETIVSVSNTDLAMIEWVEARWEGHRLTVARPRVKVVYTWRAQSRLAVAALEDVLEFLITKRARADLLLKLARTTRQPGRRGYTAEEHERRQALCAEITLLNRRGA